MHYPLISMITPFDSSRGNLRQRLRESQFVLGIPPVFNLHVQKSVQAAIYNAEAKLKEKNT